MRYVKNKKREKEKKENEEKTVRISNSLAK